MTGRSLRVRATGALTTVQDPGRSGLAHLGVPRSGWLDPGAATLANRLVGNPEDAAVLECVLGGLSVVTLGQAIRTLAASAYRVAPDSDRVGLRLEGAALARARSGELASEGIVLGAIQVPPGGRPLVFLNDHPTTGGYPVIGVVEPADLARCAQLRPGEEVRFRWA